MVGKVVRSEILSIAFIFGSKHVTVPNFMEIAQELQPVGLLNTREQRGQTEIDSKSVDIIKRGSISSSPES